MAGTNLRVVLAANLRRMIERATPPGQRPSVRAWALSKGLDVRLIDRLTKAENAITLDKLDEIADVLGLKAWHLLLDDLDPSKPPTAPITEEERRLLRTLRSLIDSKD